MAWRQQQQTDTKWNFNKSEHRVTPAECVRKSDRTAKATATKKIKYIYTKEIYKFWENQFLILKNCEETMCSK